MQIDLLCEKLGRIPNYQEVIQSFSVAISRKNLLVTTFLNEIGLLIIDKDCQEEQANKDMINRYLKKFKQGSWESKILKGYYEQLRSKTKHKGSIRSIRLALGSAVKLLEYKKYFDDCYLTNRILEGYLWKYSGQRNSITGFIHFLQKSKVRIQLPLVIPSLQAPSKSFSHLKCDMLEILRKPQKSSFTLSQAIRTMIGYLHYINIPQNVKVLQRDIHHIGCKRYLIVAKRKFYLPYEIDWYLE